MPETSIDMPSISEDAQRLIDLLAVFPELDNDEDDWWEQFAEAEQRAHNPGREPTDRGHYMKGKLLGYRDTTHPFHVQAFAMYCLMFFDDPSPEMLRLVGRRMEIPNSSHRLLESICELAWKIYLPMKVDERLRNRQPSDAG